MSKINTFGLAPSSQLIDSKTRKISMKSKSRYWIVALSIFFVPSLVQQAEAKKPIQQVEAKKPKPTPGCCEKNGWKEPCIICTR